VKRRISGDNMGYSSSNKVTVEYKQKGRKAEYKASANVSSNCNDSPSQFVENTQKALEFARWEYKSKRKD
jgi:hypothetical protein